MAIRNYPRWWLKCIARLLKTELKDAREHRRVPVLEGQISSSGTIRAVPVGLLPDEVTLFVVRFMRKFVGG